MYFAIDIGGTTIKLGASKNLKTFWYKELFPTPKNFEMGLKILEKKIKNLAHNRKIQGISIAIAGEFNQDKSQLIWSPNLKHWLHKPLKKDLESALDCKVYLENDANLAGLGEAIFGAGKSFRILVYLTISTGVGGARIVNKKIDRNIYGFEPGQQILNIDNFFKHKWPSTLEDYISGRSVEKIYGKKPYQIFDSKIWDKYAKILSLGLVNITFIWSPEAIILGGSMMKKIGIPINKIRTYYKRSLKIPLSVKIYKAKLIDFSGIYGGLAYLKQKILYD